MMVGMGQLKPLLVIGLITTTAINLAISLVLTPRIGVAGVIWGTVLSTGLSVIPYLRLYLRTLALSWAQFGRQVVWPTLSIALAWGGLLFGIDYWLQPAGYVQLGLVGFAGMATYGLMVWGLGLNAGERATLLQTVRVRAGSKLMVDSK